MPNQTVSEHKINGEEEISGFWDTFGPSSQVPGLTTQHQSGASSGYLEGSSYASLSS